MKTVSIIWTEK